MPVVRRIFNTGAGANQWPNGAFGIVPFAGLNCIPRNTRVRLHRIAWFTAAPAVGNAVGPGGVVSFELRDSFFPTTSRVILLDAIAGTSKDPNRWDGSAAVDLCGTIVPRILGVSVLEHFEVLVTSSGLVANVDTVLMVDWDLEPWPDTAERSGVVVGP